MLQDVLADGIPAKQWRCGILHTQSLGQMEQITGFRVL